MTCDVCYGDLEPVISDMPFSLGPTRIVIVKDLPVLQCRQCAHCLIAGPVMERVDDMLSRADASAELEIFRYAA